MKRLSNNTKETFTRSQLNKNLFNYGFSFLIILLFCDHICSLSENGNSYHEIHMRKKSPIVLIPGLQGSTLEMRMDRTKIPSECVISENFEIAWTNIDKEYFDKCVLEYLRLQYNEAENKMYQQSGSTVRPYKFGLVDGVECLNPACPPPLQYLKYLISYLESTHHYTKNQNIVAASYDFRFVGDSEYMDKYFQDLKGVIEDVVDSNGGFPATIISHSMGGPVAADFLISQPVEWKSKYIDSYLSIVGAYGGYLDALKSVMFHYPLTADKINIDKGRLKRYYQSRISSYYMMMSEKVFAKDLVIFETSERNYTLGELDDILDRYVPDFGSKIHKSVKKIPMDGDIGVDFACVVSSGRPTPISFKITDDQSEEPNISYTDGDGILPTQSLRSCTYHFAQNSASSIIHEMNNLTHTGIVKHDEMMKFISEWIDRK